MTARKPTCRQALEWIRENAGREILAPLTGQDAPALMTFVHALELYAHSDSAGMEHALLCMRHAVLAMQPKVRWIARELIAFWFDWGDRDRLWPKIMDASAPPHPQDAAADGMSYGGKLEAFPKSGGAA